MKLKWINFIPVIFFFLTCHNSMANNDKRVLFISSYNSSFPTFFEQIQGIKYVLDSINVELDVEFMDSKRFADSMNYNVFYQSISYKINRSPEYSAVITSDDNALNFVLQYQHDLFYQMPIVFCGVNDKNKALAQNKNDWVTGVVEAVSMEETIDLMLQLFPDARKIYSLSDATKTGHIDLRNFENNQKKFKNTKFLNLSLNNFTFNEYPQKLRIIDSQTPTLLLSALNDSADKHLDFDKSLVLIKQNLDAPLFHLYHHGMGQGVLGGKLISHFEQGKYAALMVKDILQGKEIASIKVIDKSPNQYVFDFNELQKYDIDLSDLPKESLIINRPQTFFSKYKTEVIWILIFLITQSMLIIYLTTSIRIRKRVQAKLKNKVQEYQVLNEEYQSLNEEYETINEDLRIRNNDLLAAEEELRANMEELALKRDELEISEEQFRLAMLATNDGIWDWNLQSNEVYFSPRWKSILGYDDEELKNEFSTWERLVHKEDVAEALSKVQSFIDDISDRYEVEFRMQHKEGHYVHILASGLMMRNRNGKAYRVIGTHQDLSDRYEHESVLKMQVEENLSLYEEYRTISEELHTKNNDLLAAEEELRANNEELYYKNEEISASEEKYRLLFENLNEGFALHEIVLDDSGNPIDYIYREVNPVFLQRIGMQYEDIIDKSAKELFPGTELTWIENFGKVALTGESSKITEYSSVLDKYYETYAFCPKKGFFAGIFNDITENVLAKKSLIAERDRINNILQGTNAGTWELNLQTLELELNERWAEMLGYTLNELLPINTSKWNELTNPDDYILAQNEYQKLIKGERSYYDLEIRQKHKNGHWVWLHSRGSIVERSESGKPIRMSGTYIDITDRKKADQTVIDQRDKYSTLNNMYEQVINGAQIGTFERIIPTDIVIRNKVAVEMLGYSLDEMGETNEFWLNLVHPDDLENTTFGCAISEDSDMQNFDITYRMKHKKGCWIWIQCKGNVSELDEDGKPLKVSGITMDVTKEKEIKLALSESEKRFKTIFDKSKTVMALVDPKSNTIVDVNDSALKYYGYSKEEIIQIGPWEVSCESNEEIKRRILSALNEEIDFFEGKHILKSGEIRNVNVFTTPISVNNKELIHFIIIDTTQAVKAKYEINQINKRFIGLDKIIHYSANSINDLLDYTLNQVIEYTRSDIGAIYHYDDDKNIFYLNNWSDDIELSFKAKNDQLDTDQLDCLNRTAIEEKPVIINGPEGNYPFVNSETLNRELLKSISIPIMANGKVVAIVWLASKNRQYSEFHAEQVMLLLDTTWILVEKQRLQDQRS
ncbi:PAS domain S-box protein [Labilibacter sediminis]|nr:PAS domain S-box protein [Labilibacter sediminis]